MKRALDDEYDLLSAPVFTIESEEIPRCAVSLPAVLELLGRGVAVDMANAQAHQRHPWHTFTTQLAAIVASSTGGRVDRSEQWWRKELRKLGGPSAFHLVTPDLTAPAFLQPPVPEKVLSDRWSKHITPDGIDTVMTARNYEIHQHRTSHPRLEHWAFALIDLQTHQGGLGRDNHGVVRMSSQLATRPGVGISPSFDEAGRFVRDVEILLEHREATIKHYGYAAQNGISLVWLEPWDGESSFTLADLDPFFIEVCRRVRLTAGPEKGISAWTTSTKARRINAKEMAGVTGDIWTPVYAPVSDKKRAKMPWSDKIALNVDETGFSYARLARILFADDYQTVPAPAIEVQESDTGEVIYLVARALARGQGKTEGYHERWVPLPNAAQMMLGSVEGRRGLGRLSEERLSSVSALTQILKTAIAKLVQGQRSVSKSRLAAAIDAADRRVDEKFFELLFSDATLEQSEQEANFLRFLVFDVGLPTLDEAIASLGDGGSYRDLTAASARNTYEALTNQYLHKKGLPRAFAG